MMQGFWLKACRRPGIRVDAAMARRKERPASEAGRCAEPDAAIRDPERIVARRSVWRNLGCMLLISLFALGCASQRYRETPKGTFSGALEVRWVESDYFIFTPNPDRPFKFTRSSGCEIVPGEMYTDGGSIPRFLWGIKGYSPWGYAPAYIIHDWMFESKHCGHALPCGSGFDDSVTVMAECLKTLMEASPEYRSSFLFDTIVLAIESDIARRMWEGGTCQPPPEPVRAAIEKVDRATPIMIIDFDRPKP